MLHIPALAFFIVTIVLPITGANIGMGAAAVIQPLRSWPVSSKDPPFQCVLGLFVSFVLHGGILEVNGAADTLTALVGCGIIQDPASVVQW